MNDKNLEVYSNYKTAVAGVQKSVTIEISPKDFEILKKANYSLCFAKKVGTGDFNVVWQSYTDYLMNNTFSWTPEYQLFGTNTFQGNIKVVANTNVVNIDLGETCILNKQGLLEPPFSGGASTSLTLDNKYGAIHPGVNQLSTGINGEKISTPIYVAPDTAIPGIISLIPKEEVMVWFEQDIETSTMFSTSRAKSVQIDLTSVNSATKEFVGFQWITPS